MGSRSLVLGGLAVLLTGCGFGSLVMPRPFALSRARLELSEDPAGAPGRFLPWAADEPYVIIVNKEARELSLYRRGERIHVYPVVLGRGRGRKLFEGDHRTPAGLYRITAKRRHRKYDRFLDLSYPNQDDLTSFQEALARGLIPAAHTRPGRLIGIHGSDKEDLNRLRVDWTFGCVSMLNRDVEEIYELVPKGTLVLIRDGETPPEAPVATGRR